MSYSIVAKPNEFSESNIREIEAMVRLAVKKGFLYKRPTNWVYEMHQAGQIVALKDDAGCIAGSAIVNTIMCFNRLQIGMISAMVWRGKHFDSTSLLASVSLDMALKNNSIVLMVIYKNNEVSQELWDKQGVTYVSHKRIHPNILKRIQHNEHLNVYYAEAEPGLISLLNV